MGSKAADKDMQPDEAMDAPTEQVAPDIKDFIGTKLHAIYSEVVNEPIPDRLIELMKRLESRDRKN